MSAKHAVMGLIIEEPDYGYRLAKRLQERCASWGWDQTVVYSALDSLVGDGYVTSVREDGPGKTGRAAPRLIYEATSRGAAFFEKWLAEASAPTPVRQDLDLKLLFCAPQAISSMIYQAHAQELACLEDLRALKSSMPVSALELTSWHEAMRFLQRDAAIHLLQARIEWLRGARELMQQVIGGSVGVEG